MAIVGQGISVALGGRPVLRGVDAELHPGEVLGIIGPNGAGKTTLLRVLACLLPADEGRVLYDGSTMRQLGRRILARRIAFLAQDGVAAWSLSVEAVIGLGRLPHRKPFGGVSEADRAAVAKAMELCDVAAFAARPLGTLSGGERRRVLLARALAVEADYLLADEPLAGLDPGHQLDTLQLLRTIAAGGTAVAVVLHDLALAARFCDRLLLIHRGARVAEGEPAAVLDDDRLAEAFGVTALRGKHEGAPFILPLADDDTIEERPMTNTETVRALLREQIHTVETQWNLGTFGAIAEFMRDPGEACEIIDQRGRLSATTARGGIGFGPLECVRLFTSESATDASWNHRVALCLPKDSCAMSGRTALTELGPDEDALRSEDCGAILFDMGLGMLQADICIRTADPALIGVLRAECGRPLFAPGNGAMGAILAAGPHRVFTARFGRCEVYQPIPPADGKSPEGPHTHVLPKLLRSGRTHAATEPVPDGFVPCAHFVPAHPVKDAMGRQKPWDERG